VFRKTTGTSEFLTELKPEIFELKGNFLSKDEKINIIKEKLKEKEFNDTLKLMDRFIEGEKVHPSFLNNVFREHNQYYKVRTDYSLVTAKTDFKLPGGRLFKSPIDINKIRSELDILFENKEVKHSDLGKNHTNEFLNWYNDRVFTTISTLTPAYNFLEKYIGKEAYIVKSCKKLIEEVCKLTGFKNGLMSIIHYTKMMGLGQHIDKLSLHLDGPIVTVNIGKEFYYDVFPVLDKKNVTPKRVLVPEGGVFFMEGDLRNRWSHGICENDPNTDGKYSLVFKMSSFSEEDLEKRLSRGIAIYPSKKKYDFFKDPTEND
jgi:hypothetical protein